MTPLIFDLLIRILIIEIFKCHHLVLNTVHFVHRRHKYRDMTEHNAPIIEP